MVTIAGRNWGIRVVLNPAEDQSRANVRSRASFDAVTPGSN
jgi:hypothetical protein